MKAMMMRSLLLCISLPSLLLVDASLPFFGTRITGSRGRHDANSRAWRMVVAYRGGERELTLDEKVHAAMEKLGLQPPNVDDDNCENGVCEVPKKATNDVAVDDDKARHPPPSPVKTQPQDDPQTIADRIARTMKIDSSMAWAALGATSTAGDGGEARVYNEQAAREMIQLELEMIAQIQEDSEEVQQLVSEGYDSFLARRALAFSERNMDDARAILIADQEDQRADEIEEKKQSEAAFKTVNVDAGFDPAKIGNAPAAAAPAPPKPAAKEAVVFEATGAQVQELVLESPVPVLLDIYADWCGPCKALSPILEEMAVKSGGAFRLVKSNSDNEKAISSALEVTALPTIFGIRDGKILHMFQGMPRSEEMMKNFMMGLLIPGQAFNPAVTDNEKQKYAELSTKLIKVAGSAAFPFSARERLQDRVVTRLDNLVEQTGDIYDTEQSAKTVRSLLSNVIRDPFATKFRTVNLANKVIAAKVARYPDCMALLKGVGFALDSGDSKTMILGKGKKIVNVAPLMVARDAIDKWIDKTRYEVAKAARKRKDEEDRQRLQVEAAARAEAGEVDDEEEEVDESDPNECKLRLRLDGKKKIHDVVLRADDPLSIVLEKLPGVSSKDGEVQITCVAKRLVVKSTDGDAMSKSLREHGLMPGAALVVKAASSSTASTTKLSDRAAAAKKKKKGSHTIQSVGIYGKDDGAKGELIDGGGGTLYEQDVTDDEEEETKDEGQTEESLDEADASLSDSTEKDDE